MQDGAAQTTRRIAMIGFDGLQVLDVTGPLEVFARASRLLLEQGRAVVAPYSVILAARKVGPVTSSSGLALVAECGWHELGELDTLLVAGGVGTRAAHEDDELVDWLAQSAPATRRYGSVCTGALLLARAGLLDGRRTTTHWTFVRHLAELAPTARVEPDAIFVRDGNLWTSAGVTAGMDMALAMLEEDWGRQLALDVAHQLVMYFKRPGGQSQLSARLAAQSMGAEGRFRGLAGWVMDNLAADLSVSALAERTGMSPRHFGRCFQEEFGMTPAKFVERARFDAALQLLDEGDESVEQIAGRCGFGSAETLRRVFIRRAGMGPAAYRERLRRGALRPGHASAAAGL
jgi:transcriptional regulator GlxA family with amidase domain